MMRFDIVNKLLFLVVALGVSFCSGCERRTRITTGEFYGLVIGQSKSIIVAKLSDQGVVYVEPEVDEEIKIDRFSLKNISRLNNAQGVCLTDGSDFSLHLSFEHGEKSSLVYHSPATASVIPALKNPQTRQELFEKISKIMADYPDMTAWSCIVGIDNIKIKDSSPADIINLQRFNSWFYYIPHSYSTATLRFVNGRLFAVDYVYRSNETP